MNRDSLLNKNLSPPLSRISISNGTSLSNSYVSNSGGGQFREPSWIPSIRGSNGSVDIHSFDYLCEVLCRVPFFIGSKVMRSFVFMLEL